MSKPKPTKVTDAQLAGARYRDVMVPRADTLVSGFVPLWCGWALVDAFVAGAEWADAQAKESEPCADQEQR